MFIMVGCVTTTIFRMAVASPNENNTSCIRAGTTSTKPPPPPPPQTHPMCGQFMSNQDLHLHSKFQVCDGFGSTYEVAVITKLYSLGCLSLQNILKEAVAIVVTPEMVGDPEK